MDDFRNHDKYVYSKGFVLVESTKASLSPLSLGNKSAAKKAGLTANSGWGLPLNNIILRPGSKYRTKPKANATAHIAAPELKDTWERVNWLTVLLSGAWQDALKSAREDRSFLCPLCNGTSIYMLGNELSFNEFLDLLYDAAGLEYSKTEVNEETGKTKTITGTVQSLIDNLVGASTSSRHPVRSKEALQYVIEDVNTASGKFTSAKEILEQNKKYMTQIWNSQGLLGVMSRSRWDKLRTQFKKIQGIKFTKDGKTYDIFQACPMCEGRGVLDIGHASMYGKQPDVLIKLYQEYIVGDKGGIIEKMKMEDPNASTLDILEAKWNQEIPVNEVYQYYKALKIKPEPAHGIKKAPTTYVKEFPSYLHFIKGSKVNRAAVETELTKSAITQTLAYLERLRAKPTEALTHYMFKQGAENIETGLTFEQIIRLFEKYKETARVDTGTLKEFIQNEIHDLQKELRDPETGADKFAALTSGTGQKETPYIGNLLIIDSPAAASTSGKPRTNPRYSGQLKGRSNTLFKYARMFLPTTFKGGKGGLPWSKDGQGIEQITRSVLNKQLKTGNQYDVLVQHHFLRFFVQEHQV